MPSVASLLVLLSLSLRLEVWNDPESMEFLPGHNRGKLKRKIKVEIRVS
jgi:hypothetical protein